MLGSLDNVLARSPEHGELRLEPRPAGSSRPATISSRTRRAATSPLRPPRSRTRSSPGWSRDFEALARARSSGPRIEYGALLVALELLRERTALEVEHRLRGGFLDELFSGEFVEDLIVKQGVAFGFDLRAPRVSS